MARLFSIFPFFLTKRDTQGKQNIIACSTKGSEGKREPNEVLKQMTPRYNSSKKKGVEKISMYNILVQKEV